MRDLLPTLLSCSLLLVAGCMSRSHNQLDSTTPEVIEGVAKVMIESTSVRKLSRIIGIEKDEAACVGGDPKYSVAVNPGDKLEILVPTSVTQIGLCGQATPTGMDYKHIPVSLKEGQTIVIKDDIPLTAIEPGFARVRIKNTSVKKLSRVIGIETDEAACVGGNPKFTYSAHGLDVLEFDFPISVTKIGLCGQGTPTGMDFKHISVELKDGEVLLIENDEVKE